MERENTLICDECHKKFSTVSAKNRHLRDFHNRIIQRKTIHIICPVCPTENKNPFNSHKDLISHLTKRHGLKIKQSLLNFRNIEEFEDWRLQENRKVDYFTSSKSKRLNGITNIYYNCSRSNTLGFCSTAKTRATKAGGSIKISGVCPSRIYVKIVANGTVIVKFIETHVGHEERLKTNEKNIIVEQLNNGVTNERILQDARKMENQNLERIDLIKRGEQQYLIKKFNIDKEIDADDMVATILKIEEETEEKQLCTDEPTTSDIAYQEELNQFIINKSENKNELSLDNKMKIMHNEMMNGIPLFNNEQTLQLYKLFKDLQKEKNGIAD